MNNVFKNIIAKKYAYKHGLIVLFFANLITNVTSTSSRTRFKDIHFDY